MNPKHILIFAALLLLISCAKQQQESTTTAADTLVQVVPESESVEATPREIPEPTDPALIEYKQYVWDLDKSNPYSVSAATEKYLKLFRSKPKAVADTAIYWFEELYAAVTNNLNEHLVNPERYDSLVMPEEGWKLSTFLTNYRDSLAANGHRMAMDEGMSYIVQDRAFMQKAFYPYASPVMVRYLSQVQKENEEGFSSDAGLTIEPETLAGRVGWWEEFYAANPEFIFQDGREWQNVYTNVMLMGMDNTPLYEYAEEGKKPALDQYYVKAYAYLFNAYPNAKITQQLKPYYQLLLAHDVTGADKFRKGFGLKQ